MKSLIFFILMFSLRIPGFGQSEIVSSIDSNFVEYSPPTIPVCFLERSESEPIFSIYLAVSVSIEPSGDIGTINANPIYGLGNSFPPDDSIWNICKSSILEASNFWKFKPVLWKESDADNQDILQELNKNPRTRPNRGLQRHLIIFRFGNNTIANEFNKFYFVNTDF